MEPSASATSSELVRSEDDEEGVLLRCQLAEDDRDDTGVSTCRSSESEEGVTDGHIGADSCPSTGPCSYTVTCTVSIALAVPTGDKDDAATTVEKGKKKAKNASSSGARKPQSYYHIEYSLLPGTSEPVKVDLVMFGPAAKVYMENETKVLKPWLEGDQLWLGWSQSMKLNVSRELLVKMWSHKITFLVWDTKDRMSTKARYDRPKAFRLDRSTEDQDQTDAVVDPDTERFGGIKSLVSKLRDAYDKENPRTRTSVKFQRENISVDYKPSELICATVDPKLSTVEAEEKAPSSVTLNVGGSKRQEKEQLSSQREKLDVATEPKSLKRAIWYQDKDLAELKYVHKASLDHCPVSQKDTTPIHLAGPSSAKDNSLVMCKKNAAHKSTQESTEEAEQMCKDSVASVELSTMCLLAGDQSLTGSFLTHSGSVCEGFCSITLDHPLLSEQLKAELNPLVITVLSASSLPSSPVPFNELQQKCLPVYCQYKFPNMPVHRTKGQRHSSDIYFRDVYVILTGLLSTGELMELLRGPMIEIEVHDRDRKTGKPFKSPAIFGTEDKLASTASATARRTTHDNKPQDPFGIAKLNLSDLLRGHRCLNLSLPIRCSHRGQWMGVEKNDWESKLPEKADIQDEFQDSPMPMGHYIEVSSKLKVHVEVARPLILDPDQSEEHCPFGRIVYVFSCSNVPVLTKLRSEILQINVAAFQLESHTEETAQKVLCSYRMSAKDKAHRNLNVLTGFHMLDKSLHLFVLEGLKGQAIKQLWETLPIKLEDDGEKKIAVLYNSGLSFSERLYDSLDLGLSPVYLHQPLDAILKEPLVYIRDVLPCSCLQGLLRIKQLCQAKKLEEVVQNDLFPSAQMLLSLKQEFGIFHKRGVKNLLVDPKDSAQHSSHQRVSQRRTHTPLDTVNKDYLEWKQTQGLQTKNFVQANIEEVHKASGCLQKPKPKVFVAEVDDGQAAHNYSIQKLNCTALAQELLREEMAKVPACRFSYNQRYHSFTVDPVDMESKQKASAVKSRAAWQTYDGFIYPGFKSSIESNRHPKRPDEARVEELRKPWRENILHRNKLSPALTRSRWPWSQHHKDFELYIKPPAVFSPEPPISIHLAGESLRQEQLQAAHAQHSKWLMKILPDKGSAVSGLSLKTAWRTLKPMPVFSVAQQTDTSNKERDSRSTSAGTFWNHRSQVDKNSNPTHTVQNSMSQLGCHWRPHSFQQKRAALTLTDEEEKKQTAYSNHQDRTSPHSAQEQYRRNEN
ncbi:hypothetical protein AOLI_G00245090 [Acnodon oligacanthus]